MRTNARRAIAAIGVAIAIGSLALPGVASARQPSGSDGSDTGVTLPDVTDSGGSASPIVDGPGVPTGTGVPPISAQNKTLGRRINAEDAGKPPAKANNRLNWHGFPNQTLAAVGQIFTFGPDGSFTSRCTGTVVRRGLIVTAGHCLPADASKIIFTPGSTWNDPNSTDIGDIDTPNGIWELSKWWVPQSWRNDERTGHDWGIGQVAPAKDGTLLGDVVGSWPIQTGIQFKEGARIYSVGYSASGWWRSTKGKYGRGQYACDDTWAAGSWLTDSSGGYELWISCPMNGGASGGPWFVQLNNGQWVIGGVNNQCNDDNETDDESREAYCTPVSSDMRSLVFDNNFIEFWNSVIPQAT